MSQPLLSRRDLMKLCAAGVVGYSLSGWLERLALAAAPPSAGRKRSCILLWMNGGPSQMDTFDLKPGHSNGGPIKEISTSAPGVRISEHLPGIAKRFHHLAIVRSLSTKEAEHGRATYLMRTGRLPGGPVHYPSIGSLVAKDLTPAGTELPGFVSIAPYRFLSPAAFGPGFLGPQYAPLIVGENNPYNGQPAGPTEQMLRVENVAAPSEVDGARLSARTGLLDDLESDFLAERNGVASLSHRIAYEKAVTLMRGQAVRAFELSEEPAALRERYGRNLFGQGCLLARRLVERGVPFVEVTLSSANGAPGAIGWDTHANNFESVKSLSAVLDTAWSTLLDDLQTRGLLDSTLIVWMGEFGRTPKINPSQGRDHWAKSWSAVLGGGGIRGGQVHGSTTTDGMDVKDNPVSVPDFIATVGRALGMDVTKQTMSNVGRPIRFADPGARPIQEVLS
jgi:Protein of unknown function (DUF1501)